MACPCYDSELSRLILQPVRRCGRRKSGGTVAPKHRKQHRKHRHLAMVLILSWTKLKQSPSRRRTTTPTISLRITAAGILSIRGRLQSSRIHPGCHRFKSRSPGRNRFIQRLSVGQALYAGDIAKTQIQYYCRCSGRAARVQQTSFFPRYQGDMAWSRSEVATRKHTLTLI